MNTTAIRVDPKDPGAKKTDGFSKQVVAEKIVNEQDQEKINNGQPNPVSSEASDDNSSSSTGDSINAELSEKVTEEPEHATQETIEDDRKQRAGINP